MTVGMKILGQIASVQPFALIVSLPNQLLGHVPITQISSRLTSLLEAMEVDEEDEALGLDENGEASKSQVPDLSEIFRSGQYVRAVVTAVHASGSTDVTGMGRPKDEMTKISRRVELCLVPERVNGGIHRSDLRPGFVRYFLLRRHYTADALINCPIDTVCGDQEYRRPRIHP
jgi:rRNA biogenesis protein RRP5